MKKKVLRKEKEERKKEKKQLLTPPMDSMLPRPNAVMFLSTVRENVLLASLPASAVAGAST